MRGLTVCCPNQKLGCKETFALGDGTAHMGECAYRTVQCPRCRKPTSAAALMRHVERCFKTCSRCGVNVPRSDDFLHETAAMPCESSRAVVAAGRRQRVLHMARDDARTRLEWLTCEMAPIANWRRSERVAACAGRSL